MIAVRILAYIVFTLFIRVKVVGEENLPKEGPVIIVANHISLFDPFMISYKLKRKVHWMAKVELFRFKIISRIIMHLGAYPVKREKRDRSAISTTEELLSNGKVVGIFPQGTRRKKERDYDVKTGAAHFALESGAFVQPVLISGKIRLFGKTYVNFRKPFKLEKKQEKYNKSELMVVAKDIMDKVYNLEEEKI